MFYALLRNKKKKRKADINEILSHDRKLVWTRNDYLQLWRNHYEKLFKQNKIPQEVEDKVSVSTNSSIVSLDMLDL